MTETQIEKKVHTKDFMLLMKLIFLKAYQYFVELGSVHSLISESSIFQGGCYF